MKDISINGLTFPVPDFLAEKDKREWDDHLLHDVCEAIALLNILNGALKNRLAADLKKKMKQDNDRLNEDVTSNIGCKNRELIDVANEGIKILNEIYKAGKSKNPVYKNSMRQNAVSSAQLFLKNALRAYKAIVEVVATRDRAHIANLINQLEAIYPFSQKYGEALVAIYSNKNYKKDRATPIKDYVCALNEAFTKYRTDNDFQLCVNVYAKTIISIEATIAEGFLDVFQESLNILKQTQVPVAPLPPTKDVDSKQEKSSSTAKPVNKILPGNFGVFAHTDQLTKEFQEKMKLKSEQRERSATITPNITNHVQATLLAQNGGSKKEQPIRNRSLTFAPDSPFTAAKKQQEKVSGVQDELDRLVVELDALSKPLKPVIN